MTAKIRVRAAVLATFVVVLGTAGVASSRFGTSASAASLGAALTIFVGDVQVQDPSRTTWLAGRSGDLLAEGSRIRTALDAKAALTLPDGSVTRLDGATELTVAGLGRGSRGGFETSLLQESGTTWNSVRQLVGGRYRISSPNNSTAEVRGTEFSFVVGTSRVRVDVWAGAVEVTAPDQSRVTVPTGQMTEVAGTSAPQPPQPIRVEDKRSSFTVFNETVEATGQVPSRVKGDSMSPGAVGAVTPAASITGDRGDSDLTFTLGWPGSTFELSVIAPDGSTYASRSSSQPPVTLVVPHAARGFWSYQVRDIESDPGEPYWVVVTSSRSRVTGSAGSDGDKKAPAEPAQATKLKATSTSTPRGAVTDSEDGSSPAPAAKLGTPAPASSDERGAGQADSRDSEAPQATPGTPASTSEGDHGQAGGGGEPSGAAPQPGPDPSDEGGSSGSGSQGGHGGKPAPPPGSSEPASQDPGDVPPPPLTRPVPKVPPPPPSGGDGSGSPPKPRPLLGAPPPGLPTAIPHGRIPGSPNESGSGTASRAAPLTSAQPAWDESGSL